MCEDERFKNSIGHEIKVLNQVLQRKLVQPGSIVGVDRVTFMHGWIISYLHDHMDSEVYQRDIENNFFISRSTVTNILKLMEKKGYIRRESVESDARLKRLELTDRGVELHYQIEAAIKENDAKIDSLLTKDEKQNLLDIIHKLVDGLEKL